MGGTVGGDGLRRCEWGAAETDAVYRAYHDEEWGVPIRDERRLFELLCLEGAQAGLSWSTILHRRDGYRRAFDAWDPERIARYGELDVARLLGDVGIVRNRAKVAAIIGNARAVLEMRDTDAPFADHLWSFVGGAQVVNRAYAMAEIPAETETSRALSADLKRRGFRFVGPTICYAFMQSAGLVNDHLVDCFRWSQVQQPA